MNGMLRDLLDVRADAAGSPDLDLHDLISRGERGVRRRRRAVVGGTVAAVVLTVGGSVALVQTGDRMTTPVGPPPANPPGTRVDVPPDATDGSEPLTYGVGATIHFGDRTIQAPEDADGLFVLGRDLVILTGGDPPAYDTRLYLLDGSELVEIASGIGRVTAGEVGSLLVWLDGDDVVIYDVAVREALDRLPLNGRLLTNPITPLEDAVYWHEYVEDTDTTEGRDRLVRYDVTTGTRTRATQAEYRAETRAAASPVLVVGSPESRDPVDEFTVVDSQLGGEAGSESGAVGPAFVAATGERLRISVPDRYDGARLYPSQWLDDDRFALVASAPAPRTIPVGDLLECSISAGQCHTVATGEQEWLLPGNFGGIGSED